MNIKSKAIIALIAFIIGFTATQLLIHLVILKH